MATDRWPARGAFVAIGLGLAVFAAMAADLLLHGPVTGADPAISTWLHEHMRPALTAFLMLFTQMHSTIGLSIMSAGLAVFFIARRRPQWIAWTLLTVQGGQLLNAGMKHVFARPRPHWDQPIITLTTASFPSGHAAGSTVFWGFVCVAAACSPGAPAALRRFLPAVAVVMVALTCLSRVYLGAHYVSDVIAGAGEGAAWVGICTLLIIARTMKA